MTRLTKAYLAVLFITCVWGTSYLAIRVVVQHYPPWLFAAIRQLAASIIIISAGLMMRRKADLSRTNLLHQSILGFLMFTLGNGLVAWGLKYVHGGVAALISTLMPLCAVVIGMLMVKGEKLNRLVIVGMLLGFTGTTIVLSKDVDGPDGLYYFFGVGAVFMATFAWAAGSVYSRQRLSGGDQMVNAGLQLFFGSVFLFLASPFVDIYDNLHLLHPMVIWPMVYLVVFGSVVGYLAYTFALRVLPVGIVTLYSYFTPLVAIVAGYFLLAEPLSWSVFTAFILIVVGVYMVNRGYREKREDF